nr:MAG TPA: hypothetical protein [Caudoviricetes sp.]
MDTKRGSIQTSLAEIHLNKVSAIISISHSKKIMQYLIKENQPKI